MTVTQLNSSILRFILVVLLSEIQVLFTRGRRRVMAVVVLFRLTVRNPVVSLIPRGILMLRSPLVLTRTRRGVGWGSGVFGLTFRRPSQSLLTFTRLTVIITRLNSVMFRLSGLMEMMITLVTYLLSRFPGTFNRSVRAFRLLAAGCGWQNDPCFRSTSGIGLLAVSRKIRKPTISLMRFLLRMIFRLPRLVPLTKPSSGLRLNVISVLFQQVFIVMTLILLLMTFLVVNMAFRASSVFRRQYLNRWSRIRPMKRRVSYCRRRQMMRR